MRRLVYFAFAVLLVWSEKASAQMQPHRAEYALRLGTAANAPRIGTAIQDISQDCGGWHLKRDIVTEIALTASWKLSLSSKLDGEEQRSGNGFRYRTVQVQNGNPRETKGRVQRTAGETRAEIVYAEGRPAQFVLPPLTFMPVAAIGHLIERLRAGATSFPALMFDAEVIGDAFLVEVTELEDGHLRPARPADKPVSMPKGKAWPAFMSFTRGRQQAQRPLFSVTALVFENGVLDRLTVETGLVTVTADLLSREMRPPPTCPRS
jgi:EipB-like